MRHVWSTKLQTTSHNYYIMWCTICLLLSPPCLSVYLSLTLPSPWWNVEYMSVTVHEKTRLKRRNLQFYTMPTWRWNHCFIYCLNQIGQVTIKLNLFEIMQFCYLTLFSVVFTFISFVKTSFSQKRPISLVTGFPMRSHKLCEAPSACYFLHHASLCAFFSPCPLPTTALQHNPGTPH